LQSGVPPLELTYFPVVECDSGRPVAFRVQTVINSVIAGTLRQADYAHICDGRETGVELFLQSLRRAIRAFSRFQGCTPPMRFFSLRCPAEAAFGRDLYEAVAGVIKETRLADPSAICVEFPAAFIEGDPERAKRALLDLHSLKVKTMITGCGREDFPLSRLVTVQPYAVLLDKTAVAWAGSRDKPSLMTSMISYIRSMGIEAYAEGAADKRRELRRTDCAGFVDCDGVPLSLDGAVKLAKSGSEYEL
ncbi:MAG: EAL domain-containing protein, partial [Candidatus Scatosoma sp.]